MHLFFHRDLKGKGVRTIEGMDICYYVLGDGIYTLRSTMMVPFKGDLTHEYERHWNFWQSSARYVALMPPPTSPTSYNPSGV